MVTSDEFDPGPVERIGADAFDEEAMLADAMSRATIKQLNEIHAELESGHFDNAYRVLRDFHHALPDEPPALVTLIGDLARPGIDVAIPDIAQKARVILLASGAELPYHERLVYPRRGFNDFPPLRIHVRERRDSETALCGVDLPEPHPVTRGSFHGNQNACAACAELARERADEFPELEEGEPSAPFTAAQRVRLVAEAENLLAATLTDDSIYRAGPDHFAARIKETLTDFRIASFDREAARRLAAFDPLTRFAHVFSTSHAWLALPVSERYGPPAELPWPDEDGLLAAVQAMRAYGLPEGALFRAELLARAWPDAVFPALRTIDEGGALNYGVAARYWQEHYPALCQSS